jgi:hypothetical protein
MDTRVKREYDSGGSELPPSPGFCDSAYGFAQNDAWGLRDSTTPSGMTKRFHSAYIIIRELVERITMYITLRRSRSREATFQSHIYYIPAFHTFKHFFEIFFTQNYYRIIIPYLPPPPPHIFNLLVDESFL